MAFRQISRRASEVHSAARPPRTPVEGVFASQTEPWNPLACLELWTIGAARKERAMPGTHGKSRWSADVTEHSDALDLAESVRKENRRANRRVAQALSRGERSAENDRFPIRDVDVDFLH